MTSHDIFICNRNIPPNLLLSQQSLNAYVHGFINKTIIWIICSTVSDIWNIPILLNLGCNVHHNSNLIFAEVFKDVLNHRLSPICLLTRDLEKNCKIWYYIIFFYGITWNQKIKSIAEVQFLKTIFNISWLYLFPVTCIFLLLKGKYI